MQAINDPDSERSCNFFQSLTYMYVGEMRSAHLIDYAHSNLVKSKLGSVVGSDTLSVQAVVIQRTSTPPLYKLSHSSLAFWFESPSLY